jgi:hypothetical protein
MISTIMIIIIIILVVVILLFLLHKSSQEREESLDIVFSGTETQTILTTFLRTPLNLTHQQIEGLGIPPEEATHADLIRKYINEDNADLYRLLETQIISYFSEDRHPNKWQMTLYYYDSKSDYWVNSDNGHRFAYSGYKMTSTCGQRHSFNWDSAFHLINCPFTEFRSSQYPQLKDSFDRNRDTHYHKLFRRGNIAFKKNFGGFQIKMLDSYEYDSEPDLIISQAYQVLPNYELTHKPNIVVVLHREEFKR